MKHALKRNNSFSLNIYFLGLNNLNKNIAGVHKSPNYLTHWCHFILISLTTKKEDTEFYCIVYIWLTEIPTKCFLYERTMLIKIYVIEMIIISQFTTTYA